MNLRTPAASLAGSVAMALGFGAPPALASPLVQSSCVNPGGSGGCGESGPLAAARAIELGPEGRSAYVSQPTLDQIAIFDVNPQTGVLTRRPGPAGCIALEPAPAGCAGVKALDFPESLAVSANGEWLYATARGAVKGVVMFRRDVTTGALTQAGIAQPCITQASVPGCVNGKGLPEPIWVETDASGRDVYVMSTGNVGHVAVLRRGGGGFEQDTNLNTGCVADNGDGTAAGCLAARRFAGLTEIALAPDGEHLYAASWSDSAVVVLDRDADTGTLTPIAGPSGCVQATELEGCRRAPVLDDEDGSPVTSTEPSGLAFRGDTRLYVSMRNGQTIALFDRSPSSGGLTQRAGQAGCVTTFGPLLDSCTLGRRLFAADDIAISPDGGTLAAGALYEKALTSYTLGADGSLSPVAGPLGCHASSAAGDCTVWAPDRPDPMNPQFSPDSRFLYVTGLDPYNDGAGALSVLKRDTGVPSCADRAATATVNTPVRIQLQCADPDGDAMQIAIAGAPATGVLGTIDPGTQAVDYAPPPGFVGRTTFTYAASAAGRTGTPATVTVDVVPGGGPLPGPVVLERISAPVRPLWARYAKYVVLRRLLVAEVPAGAAVQIRCRGRSCPYARRTLRIRSGRATTGKAFKRVRLRPGSAVEVRITKPGAIGKVVVYAVPKKGFPIGRVRCLPPGASRPTAC